MKFPPSLLDEIRARLPVSHVVGRRVKLKRQGREFAGLSPFKQEKTPSFTVNDQKGFYHCFASGEHGDIFTFTMKTEGLSFPEAVERLAREAGVEMPKPSPQAEAREAQAVTLRKITEASCRFFQSSLDGPEGREARTYLNRRGLGDSEIASFRIGYAPPGRHQLKEYLAAKGFRQEDMAASGMIVAGEDIPVSYDRFRNRLIFPIADLRSEVVAFGGRALGADQQPKYLNSPETPLFHKGSMLFNAAAARKAAHEKREIIVAEGYMDVIAFARAGFPNAVAPLGTALTVDQLRLLWRMADQPILCFDGDNAGIKAAHRAVEAALPHLSPGKSLAFVFLPEGLDPDDLLREHGPGALEEAIRGPQPLVDVLWRKEYTSGEWTTPERRAQFETRLNDLVEGIADRTVRLYYAQEMRQRLRNAFSGYRHPSAPFSQPGSPAHKRHVRNFDAERNRASRLSGGFTGSKRGAYHHGRDPGPSESLINSSMIRISTTALPGREALILKTVLNHPWLLDEDAEEIAAIQFEADALKRLRDAILNVYSGQNPLDKNSLYHQLSVSGYSDILDQVENAITHDSDWNTLPDAASKDVLRGWRHKLALHRKSVELKRELQSAEKAFAIDPTEENFFKLQDLTAQLWSTDGMEAGAES